MSPSRHHTERVHHILRLEAGIVRRRFTADSMQHSRGPPLRPARGGGFGPADGKWSHDKFEELADAKPDATA